MTVPAGQTPLRISPQDCTGYAHIAGFSGAGLVTIVAICGAESGYVVNNYGDVGLQDSTWGPSIGLAQIRSLKAQRGTGQDRDETRLVDPLFNLRSAFHISNGGRDFSAWSTWWADAAHRSGPGRGAFLQYVDAASKANPDLIPPDLSKKLQDALSGGGVIGDITDIATGEKATPNPLTGIEAVGAFFASLLDPHTWWRASWFVGGGLLIGVALYMVNDDFASAVKDVGGAAAKAAAAAAA